MTRILTPTILTLVALFALLNSSVAAERQMELDTFRIQSGWTFTPEGTENTVPIVVGFDLADQLISDHCCSGVYRIELNSNDIGKVLKNIERKTLGLYLPAIGGKINVRINGQELETPDYDFSTIGPILVVPSNVLASQKNVLEIFVSGPRTTFSGLWKAAPIFGVFYTLEKDRAIAALWQRTLPWISSVILAFFSLVFGGIFFQTGKRFPSYLSFSFALLGWSIYFIFVSGVPRDYNYIFGSLALYPSRMIAGLGLFLLIAAHTNVPKALYKTCVVISIGLIGFEIIGALLNAPTFQMSIIVLAGPMSILPAYYLSKNLVSHEKRLVFLLSIIALVGQTCDAFKLMDGLINIHWPLPYLNRVTIVPLLLTSLVVFVREFAGHFRNLRFQQFRARGVAKMAFILANRKFSEKEPQKIIRMARRTFGAKRSSAAKNKGENKFTITAISGIAKEALGTSLNIDRHPHIRRAIESGQIQIENMKKRHSELWATTSCIAIPIPLRPNPEYLLLLSDPVWKPLFTEDDKPHLSQFTSALWTNLERERQEFLREEAEQRFRNLLEKIDPNLYEYIKGTLSLGYSGAVAVSRERAIGFFDQKLFTTLLETLPRQQARILVTETAQWVAKATFRFGGRVKAYYGDAFVLETINLGNESQDKTVTRMLAILWELQDTVPTLNQRLLSLGLKPINFRFGAHFGEAEEINVAFIDQNHQTLIGDSVNIAARVQGEARPGEVFVTEIVSQMACAEFTFEKVARKFLKNRDGEIQLYRMIGKKVIIDSPDAGAA